MSFTKKSEKKMENELSSDEVKEILDLQDNSDEVPEWAKQFKQESVNKMTEFDFNPQLNLELNKVYVVVILEPPFNPKDKNGKPIEIDGNKMYKMIVDFDGMIFDLLCSNSMLFKMEVHRKKNNWTEKDFAGKVIALQKTIGKINGKKANLIEIQFK
jgi:hypothetical protein